MVQIRQMGPRIGVEHPLHRGAEFVLRASHQDITSPWLHIRSTGRSSGDIEDVRDHHTRHGGRQKSPNRPARGDRMIGGIIKVRRV